MTKRIDNGMANPSDAALLQDAAVVDAWERRLADAVDDARERRLAGGAESDNLPADLRAEVEGYVRLQRRMQQAGLVARPGVALGVTDVAPSVRAVVLGAAIEAASKHRSLWQRIAEYLMRPGSVLVGVTAGAIAVAVAVRPDKQVESAAAPEPVTLPQPVPTAAVETPLVPAELAAPAAAVPAPVLPSAAPVPADDQWADKDKPAIPRPTRAIAAEPASLGPVDLATAKADKRSARAPEAKPKALAQEQRLGDSDASKSVSAKPAYAQVPAAPVKKAEDKANQWAPKPEPAVAEEAERPAAKTAAKDQAPWGSQPFPSTAAATGGAAAGNDRAANKALAEPQYQNAAPPPPAAAPSPQNLAESRNAEAQREANEADRRNQVALAVDLAQLKAKADKATGSYRSLLLKELISLARKAGDAKTERWAVEALQADLALAKRKAAESKAGSTPPQPRAKAALQEPMPVEKQKATVD